MVSAAAERGGGAARRWYRLRGEVGGVVRSFLLAPGESRLGSLPSNDLVLPVRGVSRVHAVLLAGDDGVGVRDMGSKNGLRVNGERRDEGRLVPGDRLTVGRVVLELEELEPGDARLAIVLPAPPPPRQTGADSEMTPLLSALAPAGGGWLADVEAMAADLGRPSRPDLATALGRLAAALDARGVCLARVSGDGEPVALATWGEVGRPAAATARPRAGEVRPFDRRDGDDAVGARLGLTDGCLLVAVCGSALGAGEAAPLLGVALRLLAAHVERPPPPPGGETPAAVGGELRFPDGYVVGASPVAQALYREMRAVAACGLPVLVRGETGVGKEPIARTLHRSSRRGDGPFVAVNCAAIPAELLEAEMFGIGRGVATGVEARDGRFREADGGTLFLDEIGEMPAPLQAKLLRALEAEEVQPVGRAAVPVDVRLVASTNADLQRLAAAGRFREDLYYRLAGCVLEVPPLRARREDVPALVERFVQLAAREAGKSVRGVTWSALERLAAYPWPGNVRELQHEVRRLVQLTTAGGVVDSTLLSARVAAGAAAVPEPPPGSLRLADHVAPLERRLIGEALRRTGGNRTQAAGLLGLSRNGLAYMLKRLRMDG